MVQRNPLVIGDDGIPQALQPGDTIGAPTTAPSLRGVTNGETSTALLKCMPVFLSGADVVKRAVASAKSTGKAIGLVSDPSIAAGAAGVLATDGVLVATAAQWDAVAGTTGGLAFGTYYFVDPVNPGKLTSTPPTATGQVNTLVGQGMSATELDISIAPPILL